MDAPIAALDRLRELVCSLTSECNDEDLLDLLCKLLLQEAAR